LTSGYAPLEQASDFAARVGPGTLTATTGATTDSPAQPRRAPATIFASKCLPRIRGDPSLEVCWATITGSQMYFGTSTAITNPEEGAEIG
jgi:hypothetical protein